MINNHDIICFSSDWKQDPLSKHHIMSRLARQNRVLWINSIGLRTPTVSGKDVGRIWMKMKSFFTGATRITENLIVISPIVIPFHDIAIIKAINHVLLVLRVKYYLKKFGMKNPILWTFLPNTETLVGAFEEKLSLYYITDDFTKFDGYPAEAIESMENRLIESSDCIIASARELARKKERAGKKVQVVMHGVNFDHFARSLSIQEFELPSDIRDIPHPILGFYGELNSWINLPMIAEAAAKRPDWSFVLIGRVAVEAGGIGYLKKLKNVYLLGQKTYDELPLYCAAFDAALIPMKMNDLTICVNPLKLREYLAAGLPVISAPLPEVKSYSDVVRFAETAEELIMEFEALGTGAKRSNADVYRKRVYSEGWDGKVEEISEIVEAALKKKHG